MSEVGVSVIIPAYNSGNSLALAVDSALAQTHRPLEIIVVNDGSTDDTADVAKNYGDQIQYVEQLNEGQGAARNTGLAMARGNLISFLDADDYWREGFLAQCVDFLEKNPLNGGIPAIEADAMVQVVLVSGITELKPPSSFSCLVPVAISTEPLVKNKRDLETA